jgi:hypothetical protein
MHFRGAQQSILRASRPIEASALGQLYGIVVGPEVEKEYPRLFGQHVAVNGRYLDAVGAEHPHHVVNLPADWNKVSRDRRFAPPCASAAATVDTMASQAAIIRFLS